VINIKDFFSAFCEKNKPGIPVMRSEAEIKLDCRHFFIQTGFEKISTKFSTISDKKQFFLKVLKPNRNT